MPLLLLGVVVLGLLFFMEDRHPADASDAPGPEAVAQQGGPDDLSGPDLSAARTPVVPSVQPGEPAGQSFLVRVLDASRLPLPDAMVYAVLGAESEELGASGPGGVLQLDEPSASDQLVAIKEGYARGSVIEPRFDPGSFVDILLGPEGLIDGLVIDEETGEPVPEALVLARPTSMGTATNPHMLHMAGSRSPVVSTAVSDQDGRFILKGLLASDTYNVLAAGDGLYSHRPLLDVHPGTAGVVVSLTRVYAVRFEFESPFGPSAVPNSWVGHRKSTRSLSLKGLKAAGGLRLEDSLAELVRPGSLEGLQDPFFVLLRSEEPVDKVGPMTLEVRMPGYVPMDLEVWATPLDSEFRPTRIPLQPKTTGFAEVGLSVTGFPGILDDADRHLSAGMLDFHSDGEHVFSIGLTFGDLQTGGPLRGVPEGEYEVRFVGHLELAEVPASSDGAARCLPFTVDPEGCSLPLDLSGLGLIDLELLDEFGSRMTAASGFHPMRMVEGETGELKPVNRGTVGSSWLTKRQRPSVLVTPGPYQVRSNMNVVGLQPPIGIGPSGGLAHPVSLNVKAGERIGLIWQRY